MFWRITPREFLIRGRSYPIYLSLRINRVELPDGSLINSAQEYFRVEEGRVLEWYPGPFSSTLEECLYVVDIHAVLRTSLYRFSWTECYGREPELREQICLPHLKPATEEELPFDPVQIVEAFHLRRLAKREGDR